MSGFGLLSRAIAPFLAGAGAAGGAPGDVPFAPEIREIRVAIDEDGTLLLHVPSLDLDGDGRARRPRWSLVRSPRAGQAEVEATTGIAWYRPIPDWSGAVSFLVAVSDGRVSASSSVTVDVRPRNDPPSASDVSLVAAPSGCSTFFLPGTDVDGDRLSWSLVRAPEGGSLVLDPATGAATWAPHGSGGAPTWFSFRVSDGSESVERSARLTTDRQGAPAAACAPASQAGVAVAVDGHRA